MECLNIFRMLCSCAAIRECEFEAQVEQDQSRYRNGQRYAGIIVISFLCVPPAFFLVGHPGYPVIEQRVAITILATKSDAPNRRVQSDKASATNKRAGESNDNATVKVS